VNELSAKTRNMVAGGSLHSGGSVAHLWSPNINICFHVVVGRSRRQSDTIRIQTTCQAPPTSDARANRVLQGFKTPTLHQPCRFHSLVLPAVALLLTNFSQDIIGWRGRRSSQQISNTGQCLPHFLPSSISIIILYGLIQPP
jgi:hypothetical protein